MKSVPQKELRNQVGEVLRRAEAGEEMEITVAGRPVARLLPLERPQFVAAARFREIYRSPTDPNWLDDASEFAAGLADPFEIFE